jgi:putative ABC transport system permease protein
MNDLKFAIRQLLKNPGFTAVAVLTLALGIGANTAIFSVVYGVLLKPLAYREPDRIVTLLHNGWNPVAPADYLDWRAQSRSFDVMAAAEAWGGILTSGDRPEALLGLRLGEGLFQLLGVQPLLGRTFLSEDFQPGRGNVIVLSHRTWQQRFAGDIRIVGRTVTLNHEAFTVIGVMPREFRFAPFWATKAEIWVPLSLAERATSRSGSSLRVFARLKSGVSKVQAQSEMDAICKRLEQVYPATNTGRTVRVDLLLDKVVGDIRPAIRILAAAVCFVLLIACANVANLLLVRATARQKEIAIRTALGASRWRTIRQLLTESLVLAAMAGALGLLIGFWGIEWMKGLLEGDATAFRSRLPRVQEIRLDSVTLVFTLTVAVLTGLIFGLAPTLQAVKFDQQDAPKEGGRGSTESRGGRRLRAALVVAEIALALVTLVGSGLMLRSFARLAAVDPGFNARNVLSMIVSLAGQTNMVGERREAFYRQVIERIEALPGVESASAINHLPLAGDIWGDEITIEGRPLPAPGQGIGVTFRVCWPRYFQTMGIALARGRDFQEQDGVDAPGVVIINEQLARRQWPNEDPIGQRLTFDDPRNNPRWLSIVGIVKNAKQMSWTDDAGSEVYVPFQQSDGFYNGTGLHVSAMTLVLRAANPLSLATAVKETVWSLNRGAPVSGVASLEQVVANALWQPRFNLILIGLFATLALTLATVGIYGVMAYAVTQRTYEFGIRLALGARRRDVLRIVLGQGMKLTLTGVALGSMGAFFVTRMMATLLFGVQPTDPATYVCVATGLSIVALLACYLPARRAAKVDPMEALRYE